MTAAASLIILFLITPLGGQITDEQRRTLRGVTAANILVRLSEDKGGEVGAYDCGIRTADLELSAARPLLDAGIRVTPRPPTDGITLEISVNAISPSGLCVASILVVAKTAAEGVKLRHQSAALGSGEYVILSLWEREVIMSDARIGFGGKINERLRQIVEQFATVAKLANQK